MVNKFNITAIVQARLSSKRFPNKVIEKINNKNILEIIATRLKKSRLITKIIFAIPKDPNEKLLKKILTKSKLNIFEGNKNDVLDRYYNCAKKNKSDIIIRITGDCPLVDASIVDSLVNTLIKDKLDFVSNWSPPTFPDGLDVSVCTYKALRKAWNLSTSKDDREHVMTYFINKKFFRTKNIDSGSNLYTERWTLDEPEDLIVLKKIFANFKKNYLFSWKEVLKLKKKHPEYFEPNSHIPRDEGRNISNSQKLWKKAKKIIPGGNMLLSKRPELYLPTKWPTYFSKSKGSKIWDLDNKKYLDMSMMGIGTNILGYNNIEVDTAVKKNIDKGNLTTLNSPEEVFLSEKLISMHPWADMAKFTRSGGEANAVAIRIARAATGKNKVAICGYHGWHDWYLAANLDGSYKLNSHHIKGLNPLGVPKNLSGSVLPFNFNDFDQLENIINNNKDIGTVKMEVSRNFIPKDGFLKKIRKLTAKKEIILIFDECTSGFRQSFGGLHKCYGVEPDIAIFGKALGNGYAINAIIGKKRFMQYAEKTFISSTFWTERIGPTAALKTLEVMERIKSWKIITKKGEYIKKKWKLLANKYNLSIEFQGLPAISSFFIKSKNFLQYKTLISQELLKDSILASNVIYFSTEHSKEDIERYLISLEKVFKLIAECEDGKDIKTLLNTPACYNSFERLN